RQDGADGESILGAAAASNRGLTLTGVMIIAYDHQGHFTERVDAGQAVLKNGYWQLKDAWVSRLGQVPEKYGSYLVSTYLTPERVHDALGNFFSISFWDLPNLIQAADKAKLSTEKLRIQYETLLARPLLCLAMVLLAATVSLRSFRSGGIQTMVTTGMIGGVVFFLFSEIARQIGIAGLAPAWVAAWLPVLLVLVISTTVLLHQEDGWVMRIAQTPHEGCGLSRGGSWRRVAAGFACALSCALIVTMTVLTADAALAQTAGATGDPFAPSIKKKESSFPKGSVFGKVDTKIDRSQPMRLQG